MKCNCGYEYEEGTRQDGTWGILIGHHEFKKSTLTITYNNEQGEWDCDRLVNKIVYICPKCGTLKIDI
jgi:hypothetical protein